MTIEADPFLGNAVLIDALSSALRRGGNALDSVPDLLKRVLAEESWREFVTQRGEHVQHQRFVDFVTARPLRGIGADVPLIKRVVADDPEALNLLDAALQNPAGGSAERRSTVNNMDSGRPRGTSKDYAHRRLRRDAPDLHAEVLAGRLSAHAAMVKAGITPPRFTVQVTSADAIAETLQRRLPPDLLADVIARLATRAVNAS